MNLRIGTIVFWLKIVALIIAATWGAIALFGEARENAALTITGWLALTLIVIGLLVSAAIKVYQWRIEKEKEAREALQTRATREWSVAEKQQLGKLSLTYYHRCEMPVAQFMQYLKGLSIKFIPDNNGNTLLRPRTLQFQRIADVSDLEQAYRLTVSVSQENFSSTGRLTFAKRIDPSEDEQNSTPPLPEPESTPPNEASTRFRTTTTRIVAITMVVGDWGYHESNTEKWCDEQKLTCGTSALLEWDRLGLGAQYLTLGDLGHLRGLRITLPPHMNLRPVDKFNIAFQTSASTVAIVDLENLRFAQHDDGHWEASFTGPELYEHIASEFLASRLKRLREGEAANG